MFGRGDLRLVLLALIEQEPRHGYDLIKVMEERSAGHYSPSPGVIYPALAMLADEGLIGFHNRVWDERGRPVRMAGAISDVTGSSVPDKVCVLRSRRD